MLFEFRYYRIMNGRRAEWVRLMEEKIIPFQISKGMVFVGSFVSLDEEDLYVWIRRFADEEERDRLYKEVYESATWKEEFSPATDGILNKENMVVMRLEATPKSVIR